jgi:GNAT superfamily N-acetyltransferase
MDSHRVVDNAGKIYSVEFSIAGRYPTAIVYDGVIPIARAKLIVDGTSAHLADIKVEDNIVRRFGPFRILKRTLNYRRIGIGSRLLELVCSELRRAGVRVIEGDLHGDQFQLSAWYSKHGFVVSENRIHRTL